MQRLFWLAKICLYLFSYINLKFSVWKRNYFPVNPMFLKFVTSVSSHSFYPINHIFLFSSSTVILTLNPLLFLRFFFQLYNFRSINSPFFPFSPKLFTLNISCSLFLSLITGVLYIYKNWWEKIESRQCYIMLRLRVNFQFKIFDWKLIYIYISIYLRFILYL